MKLFSRNKKGQMAAAIGELAPFVISFGLAVVIGAIFTLVAGSVDDDFGVNTSEENVSRNGLDGLQNVSNQWGTIGTVGGVLVLLVMVLGIFGVRRLQA